MSPKLQAWAVVCADGGRHRGHLVVWSDQAVPALAKKRLRREAEQLDTAVAQYVCGPHTVVELGAVEELRARLDAALLLLARVRMRFRERDSRSPASLQICDSGTLFEGNEPERGEVAAFRLLSPLVEKEPESE